MSTDFRRGFNQKISRMDEALMQFTDTQAAFCKELRDNLGARLGKRGQELEALSDQIASLVRTTTTQITSLEKVASDQMYAGQSSIEKTLAITQAIRDSQLRAIQNYHKQTFLPVAAAIATILTEQASALTSMGVELITKVEMLQDVFLTYATREADTLKKLTQDVEMFSAKHSNLVARTRDHSNQIYLSAESFVREIQNRMNNVVKELVLIRMQSQTFISANNDSHNDISFSVNQTQAAVEELSQGLKGRLDNATDLQQEFGKVFKRETDHFSAIVESGISEALVSNHASVSHVEEAELDTRVFVGTAKAAWEELYLTQEGELRKEADILTQSLQTHTHHTQNVLAGMRSTAETHELVLEEQRMSFQQFIKKRQDALDNQCAAVSDWATLMSTELRRRDEDLHRFLSEDLQYTTVTVADDDDYRIYRRPDGSWAYQSDHAHAHGLAHARQTTPNVTYQFARSVYSGGSLPATQSSLTTRHESDAGTPPHALTPTAARDNPRAAPRDTKSHTTARDTPIAARYRDTARDTVITAKEANDFPKGMSGSSKGVLGTSSNNRTLETPGSTSKAATVTSITSGADITATRNNIDMDSQNTTNNSNTTTTTTSESKTDNNASHNTADKENEAKRTPDSTESTEDTTRNATNAFTSNPNTAKHANTTETNTHTEHREEHEEHTRKHSNTPNSEDIPPQSPAVASLSPTTNTLDISSRASLPLTSTTAGASTHIPGAAETPSSNELEENYFVSEERETDVTLSSSQSLHSSQKTGELGNHTMESKKDTSTNQIKETVENKEETDGKLKTQVGKDALRQNDGEYQPPCRTPCDTSSNPANTQDSEDESVKRFRKILQDAQEAIKKFRMDFQHSDANVTRSNASVTASLVPWEEFVAEKNAQRITRCGNKTKDTGAGGECDDSEEVNITPSEIEVNEGIAESKTKEEEIPMHVGSESKNKNDTALYIGDNEGIVESKTKEEEISMHVGSESKNKNGTASDIGDNEGIVESEPMKEETPTNASENKDMRNPLQNHGQDNITLSESGDKRNPKPKIESESKQKNPIRHKHRKTKSRRNRNRKRSKGNRKERQREERSGDGGGSGGIGSNKRRRNNKKRNKNKKSQNGDITENSRLFTPIPLIAHPPIHSPTPAPSHPSHNSPTPPLSPSMPTLTLWGTWQSLLQKDARKKENEMPEVEENESVTLVEDTLGEEKENGDTVA